MLNDRHVSPDVTDPEPLTLSHFLYCKRICIVPHPLDNPEEFDDPSYIDTNNMRKRGDK